jgi:hypothetical protein
MSVFIGLPLGIVFDIFRTVRLLFPHKAVLVALEDIFCLFIFGVLQLIFAVSFAGGEFRIIHVFGAFWGFVLYLCTFGSVFVPFFRKVYTFFSKSDKVDEKACFFFSNML